MSWSFFIVHLPPFLSERERDREMWERGCYYSKIHTATNWVSLRSFFLHTINNLQFIWDFSKYYYLFLLSSVFLHVSNPLWIKWYGPIIIEFFTSRNTFSHCNYTTRHLSLETYFFFDKKDSYDPKLKRISLLFLFHFIIFLILLYVFIYFYLKF